MYFHFTNPLGSRLAHSLIKQLHRLFYVYHLHPHLSTAEAPRPSRPLNVERRSLRNDYILDVLSLPHHVRTPIPELRLYHAQYDERYVTFERSNTHMAQIYRALREEMTPLARETATRMCEQRCRTSYQINDFVSAPTRSVTQCFPADPISNVYIFALNYI